MQIVGLLLPVLNLDNSCLMPQSASGTQFGHTALDLLPVDHEALPRRADDKALLAVQQGFQQFFRSPPRSTAQMPRPCVCARTRSTPASTSTFSLVKSLASAEYSFRYPGT